MYKDWSMERNNQNTTRMRASEEEEEITRWLAEQPLYR